MVLAELFSLLRQSVVWFENLASEHRAMSEVRYNELETGLSSSNDPVEVEEDTAASSHNNLRPSMLLGKCVAWTSRHILGLERNFNSLRRLRFVFLTGRNELVTSCSGRYASMRLLS